jgi:hypothetical protein
MKPAVAHVGRLVPLVVGRVRAYRILIGLPYLLMGVAADPTNPSLSSMDAAVDPMKRRDHYLLPMDAVVDPTMRLDLSPL